METKKITNDIREQLRAPLPKEAITKHPTKSYLSSIKGIFIVERLNDVFGVGSWKQKSTVVTVTGGMVVVDSTLTIPEYGIELQSFGGNDNGGENSKNFDLGDAYKGACTDALSKMCSFLEIAIDVFKGNPNSAPKQEEKKPEQPKNQANGNSSNKGNVLLSKKDKENPERWGKVVKWLKDNNKVEADWPAIKDKGGYLITEAEEKELFEELDWLPF